MKKKSVDLILVSLSSAYTAGPLAVAKNIFNYFAKKNLDSIVVSEHDYSNYFPDNTFFKLHQIEYKDELSRGGAIDSNYDSQLLKFLNKVKPKAIIFLSFFSPNLIKNTKYPCYLVSYRFRDTHQELFLMNKSYTLFKKVYFMYEAYEIFKTKNILLSNHCSVPNVYYAPPLLSIPNHRAPHSKRRKIIVTCGGGGLQGANRFLLIANEALHGMDFLNNFEIDYIGGPFNQKRYDLLLSDNARQYDFVKDLYKEFRKSRLVICEAGPNTVNELIATNTPALLVPGFRLLDNQELRAVKSSLFRFDWIFPQYLTPQSLRNRMRDLLNENSGSKEREVTSKLLFRGKNILLDSLYKDIVEHN